MLRDIRGTHPRAEEFDKPLDPEPRRPAVVALLAALANFRKSGGDDYLPPTF